jgi:hypothetical protein
MKMVVVVVVGWGIDLIIILLSLDFTSAFH